MADLVSVVIPVFNTNDRFRACFESVLNQKYKEIEVILVDDGSSDTSAKICDMIALSTVYFPVFVVHKTNGGVSRARNLGIDFAGGKYLVFIDSDDLVTPDYISDFMDARKKYPDVGHIWCGFEWSSQNEECIYSDNELVSLVNRDDYFDLAGKILTQSPCIRVYDVSILKNNNIRMIKDLSLTEDLLFNLEYMDAVPSTKICVLNRANYIYLDSDSDSLNHRFRDDLKEIYDNMLETVWQYTCKWGLNDSHSISEYYNTVYYKSVDVLTNTFHSNNKMTYFKKIKYNNDIIRSDRFISALSSMSISIPNRLRKAYKTKNYFWVRVYERLVKVYGCIK